MERAAYRSHYDYLHTQGMAAKSDGLHEEAYGFFVRAGSLALEQDNLLDWVHAETPAARALWSIERFNEARAKLDGVLFRVQANEIKEEIAITKANLSRLIAVQAIRENPSKDHKQILKEEALPLLKDAFIAMSNHPHLYYRYAIAHHGSVLAALAGDRRLARDLIRDGFRVALRRSPPFDECRTYEITPGGLIQLVGAMALVPLGSRTPFTGLAKSKLIR